MPNDLTTDETEWHLLGETFQHDVENLRSMRFETREEALERRVDKKKPKLNPKSPISAFSHLGDDLNEDDQVRHPDLIPSRRTNDDDIQDYLDRALSLIPELVELFRKKEATASFLTTWGAFQFCTGIVMSAYFAKDDDRGHERAGVGGGQSVSVDQQRKWLAHLILLQIDKGRERWRAERDVAQAIADHIKQRETDRQENIQEFALPERFNDCWYRSMLQDAAGNTPLLKTTYLSKALPTNRLRELITLPINDIPSTNIPIPMT